MYLHAGGKYRIAAAMRRAGFILAMTGLLGACSGAAPGGDDEVDATIAPDAAPPVDAPPPIDAGYSADPAGCDDPLDAIYATPADLPPLDPAARGDVVRCARGVQLDAAAVQATAEEGGATMVPTTGVRVVKLAYRTVRGDGTATVTTATAYLPLVPRALPVPVALVARSTSGIADACAPSRDDVPLAQMALPFAGTGYAVIAPDFSGLGNEGVHLYLDNREAANQLFDGARALERLIGAGLVGEPRLAIGYSQGGGVVLSAQALEHELTGRRALRGVVAIAPEWPIRVGSFGYERVLRNPDQLSGTAGLAPPSVTVMRHYGWFDAHLGPARAADSFPAEERAQLVDQLESLCTIELGAAIGANQRHLRDLVDEGFRTAMLACIDGTAGCTGTAQQFHAWLGANVVTADPAGAAVLIVQGLGDQVMPAASEAACDVAKLHAEGVTPDVCSDTFATHDTILERKIEHGVAWAEAAVAGQPRPACASSFLPACTP